MSTNEAPPSRARTSRQAWPFWIGAILVLVAPASVMLASGNTEAAWITAASSFLFTLLTRVEDLAELSLGPLKAKMREQVREAAATVAELKSIAASTAAANLATLMSGNFMGGASLETRLDSYDQIIAALREIGFSREELGSITSEWRKGMGVIYHRAIRTALAGRATARDHTHAGRRSSVRLLTRSKLFAYSTVGKCLARRR